MVYLGAIFTYFGVCQLGPAIFYSFYGTGIYPVWGRWLVAAILLILAIACFAVSLRRKKTVPFLVRIIGAAIFAYGLFLVVYRYYNLSIGGPFLLLFLGPGVALMIDGMILALFNIGQKRDSDTDPRLTNRSSRKSNRHGDIFEDGNKREDIF